MKTVTFDRNFYPPTGGVLQVNASKKRGCYLEILQKIHEQLCNMLSHHNRVLIVIMVFHQHEYTPDNKLFSRFIRKLRKRFCEKYQAKRLGFIWVREKDVREAQHYHLAVFLDGSKVQTSHSLFEMCANIWEGWNQPRPVFCPERCYYQLKRIGIHAFKDAFYHLSYFAKTHTKGDRPSATNDYSTSRIQKKGTSRKQQIPNKP